MTARVEAHLRRENRARHSGGKSMFGDLFIDYAGRCVYCNGETVPFSKKEFDIIEFLSLNAGQVFDREGIYERLWGYDAEGSSDILKEPLDVLGQGIAHIADNDLSFSMGYQKQDELGRLCGAFETMRRELLDNNRRMWALLEERKKINASISHDLRMPLTVIKGYSEYLGRNVGRGVLTEDGTREIAGYIHRAAAWTRSLFCGRFPIG